MKPSPLSKFMAMLCMLLLSYICFVGVSAASKIDTGDNVWLSPLPLAGILLGWVFGIFFLATAVGVWLPRKEKPDTSKLH